VTDPNDRFGMPEVAFQTARGSHGLNSPVIRERIALAFGAINQGLFGAQPVVLIALGAYLTMAGKFSAGMLIAFVAYADQFSSKIGGLIDKMVEFRMLQHFRRFTLRSFYKAALTGFADIERTALSVTLAVGRICELRGVRKNICFEPLFGCVIEIVNIYPDVAGGATGTFGS